MEKTKERKVRWTSSKLYEHLSSGLDSELLPKIASVASDLFLAKLAKERLPVRGWNLEGLEVMDWEISSKSIENSYIVCHITYKERLKVEKGSKCRKEIVLSMMIELDKKLPDLSFLCETPARERDCYYETIYSFLEKNKLNA